MSKRCQCLTKGCKGKARSRGLCGTCYMVARAHIKRGSVTWDDLVDLGLALPDSRLRGATEAFNSNLIDALHRKASQQPLDGE